MSFPGVLELTAEPAITVGIYSADDAVGGMNTFELPGEFATGGIIEKVVLTDDASIDSQIDVFFFDVDFAVAIADNAAFAPAEDQLEHCFRVASIAGADYLAAGTPSVATLRNQGITFQARTLFAQMVTRGTPTYVATDDLTLRIGIRKP